MYVLGIESATPVAAVAVASGAGILAERVVLNQRTHSVNLLPMIKATLADAGVKGTELAGVAVSSGPGSFTGLRIGMSVAKTLAQVWGIPVAAVSTLRGLAYQLAGHSRLLCPILNARKNEVYTAVYEHSNPADQPEVLASPLAVGIAGLIEILEDWRKPVTFLGDAVPLYRTQLNESLGERAFFAPAALSFPRGAVIAELGLRAIADGHGADPLELQPEYIRFSEAETLWRNKNAGAPSALRG